ncbi:FixH family protein [Nonomuraea sp. NPDC049758]|uniref:FixH family protein n=1 Tax=Nonomuraea sp. NPDC049758 TaxID=3154360 RepID=UPI003440BE6F
MRRILAVAALLAAALAVFLYVRGSAPGPLTLTSTGERYAVTVLVPRPTTGRVTAEVRVTSGDPHTVALSTVMPGMGHATPEIVADPRQPGRYVAEGELFPMAGVWELSVRLSGAAGEEVLVVKAPITG